VDQIAGGDLRPDEAASFSIVLIRSGLGSPPAITSTRILLEGGLRWLGTGSAHIEKA
jgi:hypothetical protein